jgi:carbonic anhydrase
VTDSLIANNARYALAYPGPAGHRPALRLAVVACMDARIDVPGTLGLSEGDAHILRNAGGVITDNEIRSLAISQRLLGTREVVLIHHTDCGMLTITDDGFKSSLAEASGMKPPWAVEAFDDLEADVRQSMARVRTSPFVPCTDAVRGFVLDVATGRLREVA